MSWMTGVNACRYMDMLPHLRIRKMRIRNCVAVEDD